METVFYFLHQTGFDIILEQLELILTLLAFLAKAYNAKSLDYFKYNPKLKKPPKLLTISCLGGFFLPFNLLL